MISAIIELYAVGPGYKKSILFEEIGDTAWKSLIEKVILRVARDERVEKNYVEKSHSWQAHMYASRCKTCAGLTAHPYATLVHTFLSMHSYLFEVFG